MINSVVVDITALLSNNGFGTLGVDLFGFEWGQGVDSQLLVLDSGGVDSDLKATYEQPTFQILARGVKRGSGVLVYNNLKAVFDFLIQQAENVTINSTEYLGFEPSGNLGALGRDKNDRFIYTSNFWSYRNPL